MKESGRCYLERHKSVKWVTFAGKQAAGCRGRAELQIKEVSWTMKLGIIRCMQTEDYCPGTRDFKTIREKLGAFEGVEEDIELVGFCSCGGCPGKKAVLRARLLVERGADTIAFASCIQKGTPIGYPCPFAKKMKELIEKDLGGKVRLLDYTH